MSQLSEYMADALKSAREATLSSLEGLTDEQIHASPGGTANPISSLFIHAVQDEDMLLAMVAGQPSLWESGWKAKIGASDELDSMTLGDGQKSFKLNDAFHEYAAAVAERGDSIVRGLSDAQLQETVDFGEGGQPTKLEVIRDYVTWHYGFHGGEISSQKGVMGLQGIPY